MKRENRRNFFDYISQAKLFKKAEEAMPYKFDKNYTTRKYLDDLIKEHPEFKDPSYDLHWDDLF